MGVLIGSNEIVNAAATSLRAAGHHPMRPPEPVSGPYRVRPPNSGGMRPRVRRRPTREPPFQRNCASTHYTGTGIKPTRPDTCQTAAYELIRIHRSAPSHTRAVRFYGFR